MTDDTRQTEVLPSAEQSQEPALAQEAPVLTKAQQIAEILNEPAMEFVDWEKLMGEGVVVRLSIKRVRFRKKLHFADLGLHFADGKTRKDMEDIFRLGMKNLLPGDYIRRLEAIESRARKLLQRSAFETVWGSFIPVTAYQTWRDENQQFVDAYYAERDKILKNYTALKREMIGKYTEAARNAYRILNNLDPQALSEREQEREAWYLAAFRRKIRKMLPSPEDITQSFDFVVTPTYIDLPLLLKGEPGEAVLEKQTIEGVTPQEQVELRYRQQGARRRQELMEQMNRDVVKKAKEQKQRLVDEFLTTMITQLRGLLYDATTNVLYSLKKHESLQPRAVVQLKNLVENLSLLNFYGDQDVERAAKLIRSLIDRPRADRDLEEIEERLREIGTVMRATLLNLEYEFREDRMDSEEPRERELAALDLEKRELAGLPRRPSPEEIREARMALEAVELPSWETIREERLEQETSHPVVLEEMVREERTW